ncbi:MAG: DUF4153 domain-containing protein [Actinomycetota bacterium]
MKDEPQAPHPPGSFSFFALATAFVAAVVLPGHPVGIGVTLLTVGVAVAVALARPSPNLGDLMIFGIPAVTLTLFPAFRAAGWIVWFDLAAALALGSLALAGGATYPQVAAGLTAAVNKLHRGLILVLAPLLRRLREREKGAFLPALRGLVLAASLVMIFGGLFASADRAFAHVTGEILVPDWDLRLLPARILLLGATAACAGALVLSADPYRVHAMPPYAALWSAPKSSQPSANRERAEWLIPLCALDLLFASFVVVQLTVLFGGHRHVLITAGLTYAEYARQGFFQLLVVAGLTLVVIAAVGRGAQAGSSRDRWLQKALLGLLCALTLVILVSALRRLGLYEEAFGFTRPRLIAHGILLWLGGIFLLLIVTGATDRTNRVPRLAVAFSALTVIAFTALDPDALIARHNLARFERTDRIDLGYLSGLSSDAVPELIRLPEPLRSCVLFPIASSIRDDEPWSAANLSRSRARKLLTDIPTHKPPPCPSNEETR